MAAGNHPTLTRNIAPGVHRLGHAYVNCYLIEDGTRVTVVDAALPATWSHLEQSLQAIGRSRDDVDALVITHAHPDHLGFAARIAAQWSVPIWVHAADERIAQHPYRHEHEGNPLVSTLRHPRAVPMLTAMMTAGALRVKGVTNTRRLPPSAVLDVPGHPTVLFTPGHTFGHCALHLPDRGVLISGDALVTLDPYTAARGPRLIAGAGTADSVMALASLQDIEDTDAATVLPGHGEPWQTGARAAVAAAREAAAL
ncbi:MBL fold metallo-hydrolase [Salinibacterium sp. ZJ454]|uniref:MBL fold metallo-hydrolase n=1 Tax=Salinibacterium sp. ZJ454 TaxID=2708339 RepID=UPI001422BD76|nr:MBL fold metallo-hydrolase [Salinibacterium sp. ZJ454]